MDYSVLADDRQIARTISSLNERGIAAELVGTKEEALARVRALVPNGASLSTGASLTLREIGFEELLKSNDHPWRNLKAEYLAETDPAKQGVLRRQAATAEFFLGSVHGVSESGEVVIGSLSGSQLAAYVFASPNIIWVVGAQKITPTLEDAIRRVREYVLPHEDKRMRDATGGKMGSYVGKLLIFERESPLIGRKVTMLLVKQVLGD